MKKIALFFILVATIFYATPATVVAQDLTSLNLAAGLVPCEDGTKCTACHLIQLANNVINWLISILMVVFAILIMWAGFKLVTSGGNTSAKQDAKNTFTNAIIGLIIVLAAWILVDTMLRALLGNNGDIAGYGPWSTISCAGWQQTVPTIKVYQSGNSIVVDKSGQVTNVDPNTLTQCKAGNTACSVSALQGVGLSQTQASIMSCIAMTESSGNPSTPPYNVTHPGSNSSACGTFQITRTTWNGNATGACSSFSNCQNAQCNAQVMATLVKKNGYRDWTCPGCNAKASACAYKYGG